MRCELSLHHSAPQQRQARLSRRQSECQNTGYVRRNAIHTQIALRAVLPSRGPPRANVGRTPVATAPKPWGRSLQDTGKLTPPDALLTMAPRISSANATLVLVRPRRARDVVPLPAGQVVRSRLFRALAHLSALALETTHALLPPLGAHLSGRDHQHRNTPDAPRSAPPAARSAQVVRRAAGERHEPPRRAQGVPQSPQGALERRRGRGDAAAGAARGCGKRALTLQGAQRTAWRAAAKR
jgi:hypothetical protein